jgi:hypothetical protein
MNDKQLKEAAQLYQSWSAGSADLLFRSAAFCCQFGTIDPLDHWFIDSLKKTRQGPFNESMDQ